VRRHRPAEDFTESVLQAYREIVARVAAIHGEPRLSHGPIWMDSDQGMARRVSTVWFINTRNHGFRVDERGRGPVGSAPAVQRTWTVEAWAHGGAVMHAEVMFRRPPDAGDIGDVARWVGLLLPVVEVTRFGDTERQFLEGEVSARCSGWPNGSWHGPDCGDRKEHHPHRY